MFTYQDFSDFLHSNDIPHRISGKSISVKDCPSCGGQKYKLLFNIALHREGEPMIGRCMSGSCGEIYTSIRYLQEQGIERSKIEALHGYNTDAMLRSVFEVAEAIPTSKVIDQCNIAPIIDISQFIPLSAMPNHFISQYAIGRGYVDLFEDKVKMNLPNGSVSFIIHNEHGEPVGYQERFLSKNAMPKCKTSTGFQKDFLLAFPQSNADILVCEGPFTALSGWHYGYYSVCTFGSQFTQKQFETIIQLSQKLKRKICFARDCDEAGRKTAKLFKTKLNFYGLDCKIVEPDMVEDGEDLNDAWKKNKGVVVFDLTTTHPSLPDIGWY